MPSIEHMIDWVRKLFAGSNSQSRSQTIDADQTDQIPWMAKCNSPTPNYALMRTAFSL